MPLAKPRKLSFRMARLKYSLKSRASKSPIDKHSKDGISNKSSSKKLRSPHRLLISSIQLFIGNFNLFIKLILVYSLPTMVLAIAFDGSISDSQSAFMNIVFIFAIMAIFWSYLNIEIAKNKKLSEIYTIVSGQFLQFTMGVILLTIIALPFLVVLLGGVLLVASLPDYYIFYTLPLALLLILSLTLIAKYSLAGIIIMKDKVSSFKAFKKCGAITKGNTLRILLAYSYFIVPVIVLYLLFIWLISLSQKTADSSVVQLLVNALFISISVPVASIYISKIHEALSE